MISENCNAATLQQRVQLFPGKYTQKAGQSGHGQNGHFRFRKRSYLLTIINNILFIYSGGFDNICFRF